MILAVLAPVCAAQKHPQQQHARDRSSQKRGKVFTWPVFADFRSADVESKKNFLARMPKIPSKCESQVRTCRVAFSGRTGYRLSAVLKRLLRAQPEKAPSRSRTPYTSHNPNRRSDEMPRSRLSDSPRLTYSTLLGSFKENPLSALNGVVSSHSVRSLRTVGAFVRLCSIGLLLTFYRYWLKVWHSIGGNSHVVAMPWPFAPPSIRPVCGCAAGQTISDAHRLECSDEPALRSKPCRAMARLTSRTELTAWSRYSSWMPTSTGAVPEAQAPVRLCGVHGEGRSVGRSGRRRQVSRRIPRRCARESRTSGPRPHRCTPGHSSEHAPRYRCRRILPGGRRQRPLSARTSIGQFDGVRSLEPWLDAVITPGKNIRPCGAPERRSPHGEDRFLKIDLRRPVAGSGAIQRGVVKSYNGAVSVFWRHDHEARSVDSIQALPAGETSPSERVRVMFRIDGKRFLLLFGAWAPGEFFSQLRGANGTGTTDAVVRRVSETGGYRSPARIGRASLGNDRPEKAGGFGAVPLLVARSVRVASRYAQITSPWLRQTPCLFRSASIEATLRQGTQKERRRV